MTKFLHILEQKIWILEAKYYFKIKLLAWKLISGKLPTKNNLRKTGMDKDYHFCGNHAENIDY